VDQRVVARGPKGIQNRVLHRTKQRFGTGFEPHGFRQAIARTLPLIDPANPGLAAGLLGISREVIEQSYNRAGQIQAAMNYHRLLDG
jgi:hypothetical protein